MRRAVSTSVIIETDNDIEADKDLLLLTLLLSTGFSYEAANSTTASDHTKPRGD